MFSPNRCPAPAPRADDGAIARARRSGCSHPTRAHAFGRLVPSQWRARERLRVLRRPRTGRVPPCQAESTTCVWFGPTVGAGGTVGQGIVWAQETWTLDCPRVILTFRDVLVTPYSDLLSVSRIPGRRRDAARRPVHRGGPHWPDFDTQHEARHCRRGEPVNDEPEWQPSGERLRGRWAWAGPISSHFGHQIIDFSMRLGPTLAQDGEARFLFAATPFGPFQDHRRCPPVLSSDP